MPYEVATTKTLNSFKNKIDKLWNLYAYLFTGLSRTKFTEGIFSQCVISEWNNLPYEVATTNTLNSFKNKIDKLWNNEKMYSF